jgi:hypothetical protein
MALDIALNLVFDFSYVGIAFHHREFRDSMRRMAA